MTTAQENAGDSHSIGVDSTAFFEEGVSSPFPALVGGAANNAAETPGDGDGTETHHSVGTDFESFDVHFRGISTAMEVIATTLPRVAVSDCLVPSSSEVVMRPAQSGAPLIDRPELLAVFTPPERYLESEFERGVWETIWGWLWDYALGCPRKLYFSVLAYLLYVCAENDLIPHTRMDVKRWLRTNHLEQYEPLFAECDGKAFLQCAKLSSLKTVGITDEKHLAMISSQVAEWECEQKQIVEAHLEAFAIEYPTNAFSVLAREKDKLKKLIKERGLLDADLDMELATRVNALTNIILRSRDMTVLHKGNVPAASRVPNDSETRRFYKADRNTHGKLILALLEAHVQLKTTALQMLMDETPEQAETR